MSVPQRDQQAFDQWIQKGAHAGMAYMSRTVDERKFPSRYFSETVSVLSLGVSYFQSQVPPKPNEPVGRVARYAWGLDYHDVIGQRVARLMAEVSILLGDHVSWTWATDSRPLLERAYAASSGAGFIGKNTLLIAPRNRSGFHVGSFLFLAEILFPVPCEISEAPTDENGCGTCMACLTACPTQAFDGPFFLSSDRCISYLTIENKQGVPEVLRPRLGDWIFGCDVCQSVCPFNARAAYTRWPEFGADHGIGPWLSLREVLELETEVQFKTRFKGTPLVRSKRRGLIRNACVVAGNQKVSELKPQLEKLTKDPDSMIQDHSHWALERLP